MGGGGVVRLVLYVVKPGKEVQLNMGSLPLCRLVLQGIRNTWHILNGFHSSQKTLRINK